MNHTIMVRVSKSQHERVRNNAEAYGYKTISGYIRALALQHGLVFEDKINKIYQKITGENIVTMKDNRKLGEFF